MHAYSTHNLLLRYWLATAGLEAGRDVRLSVVPPARAVEALQSGQIAGFCAGAPWGEIARADRRRHQYAHHPMTSGGPRRKKLLPCGRAGRKKIPTR